MVRSTGNLSSNNNMSSVAVPVLRGNAHVHNHCLAHDCDLMAT